MKDKFKKINDLSENADILKLKFDSITYHINKSKTFEIHYLINIDVHKQQAEKLIKNSQNLYDIINNGILALNQFRETDYSKCL